MLGPVNGSGTGMASIGNGPGPGRAGGAAATVFVVGAGQGRCIDGIAAGDLIAVDCPGIPDFAALRRCLADDGAGGTRITLPDGSVTRVPGLDAASLGPERFSFGAVPVCFVRGTLIDTAAGARRIETLRPGDLIRTCDNGLRPLLYVSRATYDFGPGPQAMKPLRLKPDALAQGWPERELLVSPEHRLGLPAVAPRLLLAARRLRHLAGVSERPNCRLARYFHLLMERHELVRANGAWAETLLVTETTIRVARIPPELQDKARQMVRPLAMSAAEVAERVEA